MNELITIFSVYGVIIQVQITVFSYSLKKAELSTSFVLFSINFVNWNFWTKIITEFCWSKKNFVLLGLKKILLTNFFD